MAASGALGLALGNPYTYARRPTRVVRVGNVGIGGNNPIRVQSMTTTPTLDTDATVAQAVRLVEAGSELVRITAPTVDDAANLREIRARLRAMGIKTPLIADIHFNPRAAIEAARWVEKVRINPGNYADSRVFARRVYADEEYGRELERIEERLVPLIRHCREYGVALRVGTNHGSLSDRIMSRFGDTPEGMVESALEFVRICERHGFRDIVLSMKASNPKVMIQAYRLLAVRMAAEGMDYPFHLGVTEAGSGVEARTKSAAGIGALLDDGIGDTIRVSLAEDPEAEIPVARLLADLYTGPRAAARLAAVASPPGDTGTVSSAQVPEARDPLAYRRRPTRIVSFGRVAVGGGEAPRVVADATSAAADPALLDRLFASGAGPRAWPDLLQVDITATDLRGARQRLSSVRAALAARAPETPILATLRAGSAGPVATAAAELADGLRVVVLSAPDGDPAPSDARELVRRAAVASRARRLALWIEVDGTDGTRAAIAGHRPAAIAPWWRSVDCLLALAAEAEAAGQDWLVLGVHSADPSRAIRSTRLLAARLAAVGRDHPLALVADAAPEALALLPDGPLPLAVPIALGSALADGLGDVVRVADGGAGLGEAGAVRLAFDCLQAAGARTFKAEIIACPSCGRTLFDLQTTTERIKARTGHLVGAKIAVMGCVVNGPGELADADFGYMGGAPGRVSLYVGRECVEKNVPAEDAEERLVALIKSRGRWAEPHRVVDPESGAEQAEIVAEAE